MREVCVNLQPVSVHACYLGMWRGYTAWYMPVRLACTAVLTVHVTAESDTSGRDFDDLSVILKLSLYGSCRVVRWHQLRKPAIHLGRCCATCCTTCLRTHVVEHVQIHDPPPIHQNVFWGTCRPSSHLFSDFLPGMATQADDDFLEEAMIACAVASIITVVMMRRRRKRRNRTIWTRTYC